MNAIRLLTQQHRDIEKWFDELVRMHGGPGLAAGWPHEGTGVRAATDSGEEIRESAEAGLRIAGPEAVTAKPPKGAGIAPESELARTATPPPSEGDGRSDDAVPGQEFRDLAGHHPDGKTHVGMDDERVRAQMFEPESDRPRPESMIGQRRENLAGVREQFDNPAMVAATGGRAAMGGGTSRVELDLRTTRRPQRGAQPEVAARQPHPESWAETPGQLDLPASEPLARGGAIHSHAQPWTEAPADPGEVVLTEHELDHKRALTARLFDALIAHTVLEEQMLYPAARQVAPELVAESIEAHHKIKNVVAELRHTDPALARFDYLLADLHRTLTEHIRQEELHLLPRLDAALGVERLEEMGARMQDRFRALLGLERRFSVLGIEGVSMITPPAVPLGHLEELEALTEHDDETTGGKS